MKASSNSLYEVSATVLLHSVTCFVLVVAHHEAICRRPITQCSTKLNGAAVFCSRVLGMSHARAGTESRVRKENPVTALWGSWVLPHQEFTDASRRIRVQWQAAVQVVGLDLSQVTLKASWQQRGCQGQAPLLNQVSRVSHPREAAGSGASQSLCAPMQACFWCSAFFFLVVLKTLETKFHPLTAGQFSCRFLCASASSAHQMQSLKEMQHPSLCFYFLWTLQVIPLSGWNCSHLV